MRFKIVSHREEISDEEVEQIARDSVKAYQSPTSNVVPGLKTKRYKCSKCGEIIKGEGEEIPVHCDIQMEITYE